MRITTTINGQVRELECDPGATLFEALRAGGWRSVKQGCDREGTCGACTVLLDGEPVLSCITPAPRAAGRKLTTVEGLGHPASPHPLQEALVDAGAVQCGYCTPGMLLAAKALLDAVPEPTDRQVSEALSGNLCRCTGYVKIIEGIQDGARRMRKGGRP